MNGLENEMNDEQKAALGEGYDMIVELMDFIKDSQSTAPMTEDAREILNDARGVLDLMNDVIYKTL
jgi:glycerol-3-phosphate dehydrogenase